MPLWLDLTIDGVLALLLIGAMITGYMVHRRLSALREGQKEMEGLVTRLDGAVNRAQHAIGDLKTEAGAAREKLEGNIRRAKSLSEELAMITEAGNNLADRIDHGLTTSRQQPDGGGASVSQSPQPGGPSAGAADSGEGAARSGGRQADHDRNDNEGATERRRRQEEQRQILAALRQAR
ncbi:DUF6468 domain-containing protein [Yunchengibacter salinarum]|uniref:DUF6468 domain-containing protein n=1 Tax=Yunchengibacter salinarum TaxID=3133399 RepID=UPI0035B5844C